MTTEEQRYLALRMAQEQAKAAECPPEAASKHREMAEIYSRRLAAAVISKRRSPSTKLVLVTG